MLSQIISKTLPLIPKSVLGYFARPYIAGETLADGIRTVRELNSQGIMATMDVLGESVSTREESLEMRAKCEEVLRAIESERLDANLSLKPTQLGLGFDTDFCEDNIRYLCRIAADIGNFVRIDMEDHTTTDDTLRIHENLRTEFPGRVGAVIQSYMRRSADDITGMMDRGPTNLRLCKGIYVEPEEIAFRSRQEVRDNFNLLNRMLLGGGAYVGIATHDDYLLEAAMQMVKELGLPRESYEFQMLLGVRPKRRDKIINLGHRMRVYVPFGDRWHAYSTRRLKENPNMALHIVKAIFGFGR